MGFPQVTVEYYDDREVRIKPPTMWDEADGPAVGPYSLVRSDLLTEEGLAEAVADHVDYRASSREEAARAVLEYLRSET